MSLDPITAGLDLGKTILDKFFPDADTELKGKLAEAAAEIDNEFRLQLSQLDINKEEAKHPSVFVAGARPAAMWVGVITLLYAGIGVSLLSWIAACFDLPAVQAVNDEASNDILLGLLGLGGMRTWEKLNGVATSRVINQPKKVSK